MLPPEGTRLGPREATPPTARLALIALATALAAGLATGWAATRAGGDGVHEGRFLAGVAAVVLALLAPAALRSRQGAATAAWCVALVLAVVAQISIADGPLRAGTLGALLSLTLAAAWLDAARRHESAIEDAIGRDEARKASRNGAISDLVGLVPLCVATQVLVRSPMLVELEPGMREWARAALEILGFPALAALAIAAMPLARAGAFDPRVVALLATLVAAGRFHASLVATLLVFALLPRALGRDRGPFERALYGVPVLAALALRPAACVVAVAAVLAFSLRRGWPAVLLVASAVLLWLEPVRPWHQAAIGPALLFAALPAAAATLLLGRAFSGRRERTADADPIAVLDPEAGAATSHEHPSAIFAFGAAIALSLVSLRVLEPRAGLVAPVLLLALAAPAAGFAQERIAQATWLCALLVLGLASQALPWLRPPGLADTLAILGWRDAAALAVLAVALVLLLATAGALARSGRASLGRAAALALPAAPLALLLLPALLGARVLSVLLEWPPLTLSAADPRFERTTEPLALPRQLPRQLVIDSALAHAGTLAAGTPVALVRLRSAEDDRAVFERTLRVGEDTGEWSAGSPALRAAPAPEPYLVAIAPPGGFFAKRYRSVIELDGSRALAVGGPRSASSATKRFELTVERDAGLPAAVTLTLFGLRLRGESSGGGEAASR
jgi:hypothetical protein